MSDCSSDLFIEGLVENNTEKLLKTPKSDIHNHSTKGCRRVWLEEKLKHSIPKAPDKYEGLEGMQKWFTDSIKPYCSGVEEIDLVGGLDSFKQIVEGFHKEYCPHIIYEPEITYVSRCNVDFEAERIEEYISTGYFKSIDVCGGENLQPVEAFLPLHRKANLLTSEQLNDIRINGLKTMR